MIALATFALSLSLYQAPVANACANGYSQNVWDPRFSPGQRWSYRNRPQDKLSILTIYKIDDVPDVGLVVHVMVDSIIFDPEIYNLRTESFAIRRDSLDASVLSMLGIVQVPSTPDKYSQWQEDCGGLTYSGTVADTVRTLQEAYLDQRRTQTLLIALQQTNHASPRPEYFKLELTFHPYEGSATGTISGQFTSRNKRDVSSATIELSLLPISQSYIYPPQPPLILKMNADGKFDSPQIPSGQYMMRVTVNGFDPDTRNIIFSAIGVRPYTTRQVRATAH